ncbi:MAG TPA: ABC transporter substrate-binding protein [Vicinamibacterales bacterium]|jgi:branched-chain amino acid transport system substrate-binding protein|nr:ABC transporter substrate-binding protein [Vicinamibacterales bacterium]
MVSPSRPYRMTILAGIVLLAAGAGCERKSTAGAQSSTGDILVGLYGSLTGDGASFGISSREGAELAVDEINKAGGLLGGRRIKLLVEDDQSKPEEASSAVTKLITQDKVVGVIGEVASRRSLAAGPVCQKYDVPMVSPASTNERVTEIGDYIFRVCFIDPFQGEVLAKFAYNGLKARKVAVLKDIQQDYSVGLTESIVRHFGLLGGQVLDPVSYSSGDADFKAILTQVRSEQPDAIFATGYYPEAAIIVRQARELGMKMPILGGDGWVGDALKNGREALDNCYISNHYSGDNPDPVVQNFVKTYRAKFSHEPDSIAALGYDAAKVLGDAITRASSTDGPKVRDALARTDVAGVTGRLKMNAKRNVDKPAVIQEVTYVNGDVKFVYKTTISPD